MTLVPRTAARVCASLAILLLVAGCFEASADGRRAILRVSPQSLAFSARQGGSDPARQVVSVTNAGSGWLRWSASVVAGGNWMRLSQTQGTGPATVYVSVSVGGLAAGTYSGTVRFTQYSGTSSNVAVTLTVAGTTPPPPTQGVPPSVQLTAPAGGATFTAPASIGMTATASDSDGAVARVDFYANGTLVGSDTTSPYGASWSGAAAGTYSLTAVATDNGGQKATSAAVGVTVTAPPPAAGAPPTVAMSSPANGATFTSPATISLTATASDSDGRVSRVDFAANGTIIGSATVAPYTVSWRNVSAGVYSVTATATDDGGLTATSASIAVTVSTQAYDYAIYPGEDIQARVNSYPDGAKFLIKTGVHRLQRITPKTGQSFTGEAGAVLSGARLLTSFARSGNYWVATGQTQWGAVQGTCEAAYPGCAYSNDLFFDDVPLKRVLSLGEVVAGTWYFDNASDTIYFADDPTGHRVETSVTAAAFDGGASNVTISNLIIEKYAAPAQAGAVQGTSTSAWVVQNCEMRFNHGMGIRSGASMQILNNNVHHNGQMGMGGSGHANVLVQGNEIAYNNTLHYEAGWEAGGTKWTVTNYLTVRGNYSHNNRGPGLWTDIDNINTLYEQNTVENNTQAGIFHEISYAAVIRNNIIRGNGTATDGWLWSAGIQIAASPNVEVYGNTVENNMNGIAALQQNRGSGTYGPHEISGLWVHDNTVTMSRGKSGLVQDIGDTSYFTSRNNRFDRNTYRLGTNTTAFEWMNGGRTAAQWQSYGLDLSGTFIY